MTNIGTTSFMTTFIIATSSSVAALVSWIYECSNTVEQRMIRGGSTNERLTALNTRNCYICKVASSIPCFLQGSPVSIHMCPSYILQPMVAMCTCTIRTIASNFYGDGEYFFAFFVVE